MFVLPEMIVRNNFPTQRLGTDISTSLSAIGFIACPGILCRAQVWSKTLVFRAIIFAPNRTPLYYLAVIKRITEILAHTKK